jgi:hypothetical protein
MKSLILASALGFIAAFSAVAVSDPAMADYTFRGGMAGGGGLQWQMTPKPFIPLVTVRPQANYYYRPSYYRPVLRYYRPVRLVRYYYPRPFRYRIHYWRYH